VTGDKNDFGYPEAKSPRKLDAGGEVSSTGTEI